MKSLVPYADSGGFSPACRVSHDFVLLFLMFSIFGGISHIRRFEPAVEPAEEYALPQDGVLGLDNPVVLVGEDYHSAGTPRSLAALNAISPCDERIR